MRSHADDHTPNNRMLCSGAIHAAANIFGTSCTLSNIAGFYCFDCGNRSIVQGLEEKEIPSVSWGHIDLQGLVYGVFGLNEPFICEACGKEVRYLGFPCQDGDSDLYTLEEAFGLRSVEMPTEVTIVEDERPKF